MGPSNYILTKQLVRWCCRYAADIKIQQYVLDKWVSRKKVKTIGDLYRLTFDQGTTTRGLDFDRAVDALYMIRCHKEITLSRMIFGLGIPYMTKQRSEDLSQIAGSLEGLEVLLSDPVKKGLIDKAFNEKGVSNVIQRWYEIEGKSVIDDLKDILVTPTNPNGFLTLVNPTALDDCRIKGKTFYVVGSFLGFNQQQIRDLIEQHGGRCVCQLSGKVEIVVCGNGGHITSGTPKPYLVWSLSQLDKAIAMNTQIKECA